MPIELMTVPGVLRSRAVNTESAADAEQCCYTLQNAGRQCKRNRVAGHKFCAQHLKLVKNNDPVKNNEELVKSGKDAAERARELLNQGKFSEVLEICGKFEEDDRMRLLSGLAYYKLNCLEKAHMDLNFVKYSNDANDMEKAEAIFTLGKAFLKSRKIVQSKNLVKDLELIHSKAAQELLSMISHCDFKKIQSERKIVSAHFKARKDDENCDPDVKMHIASEEKNTPKKAVIKTPLKQNSSKVETPKKEIVETPLKQYSKKESHRNSPTQNDPAKVAESHNKLATEAFKNHNYVQAISLFSAAIDLDPIAKYYSNRAASRMHLALYSEALQDCFLSIEKDPIFEKSYSRAIHCYFKLGKFDKALELTEVARERIPSFEIGDLENKILCAKQSFSEVVKCIGSSDFRKASSKLEDLKSCHPDLIDVKILEIEIELGEGRMTNALKLIQQTLEKKRHPDLYRLKGALFFLQGEFDQARVELRMCIKLDPENAKAALTLKKIRKLEELKEEANSLFNSCRYESAIQRYMEALKIDSSTKYNSIIYSNMAAAYMRISRFKEALEQCSMSLAKNSENLKALSRRIECLFKLHDYHAAIIDLEKLRRLDPSQELECTRRIHQAEQEISKQPKQDYYSILGLNRDASSAQIKSSYKKLALELHPDKFHGKSAEQRAAEYKFKLVVEAYGVLSDPETKSQYDLEQFPTPFPAGSSYPFSKGNQGHRQYEGFKFHEPHHQKENVYRYRNGNPWF